MDFLERSGEIWSSYCTRLRNEKPVVLILWSLEEEGGEGEGEGKEYVSFLHGDQRGLDSPDWPARNADPTEEQSRLCSMSNDPDHQPYHRVACQPSWPTSGIAPSLLWLSSVISHLSCPITGVSSFKAAVVTTDSSRIPWSPETSMMIGAIVAFWSALLLRDNAYHECWPCQKTGLTFIALT